MASAAILLFSPRPPITVTAPVITSLPLSPSALTMMVGDERTFALTDQDGKAITGAAWTVDLPTVATLSADDPPIITAVNPGTATITAFIGSVQTQATVNVVPYSSGHIFPPGTVLWSTPAGVPGRVLKTTPTAGAAAFIGVETDTDNNTTLRGISGDGQQMWQSAALHNVAKVTPVDSGNVAVLVYENNLSSLTIRDGGTGQPAWSYANANFIGLSSGLAVRQDGTVFTIEYEADGTSRLLGLDGATGARLVNYQLPNSTQTNVDYPNPTFN